MSESLGTLHVKLDADTATFKSKLEDAKSGIAGFASSAGSMMTAFAGGFIGGALVEAAGHAIGAVKEFITSGAEAADQMGKLAQRTGIPVQEMSRLSYAASLADVSTGQLSLGLRQLEKGMADAAAGGTSKAAKALEAMGISATDASGKLRPTSDVLKDVAGRFAGYEDGAGKAALAMALFGRSGDTLIPMLNQGATGIARVGAELDAFGGTITPAAARTAEEFNDNLKRLHVAGQGFAIQLAGQLTPALSSLTAWLVDSAKGSVLLEGIANALTLTMKTLFTGVVAVGAALDVVWKMFGGLGAAVGLALQGEFREAGRAVALAGGDMVGSVKGALDRIRDMWTDAGSEGQAEPVAAKVAAPLVATGRRVKAEADKAVREAESARERLNRTLAGFAVKEAGAFDNTEVARVQVRLDTGGDLAADLAKLKPGEAAEYREKLLGAARAVDEMKESAARAKANQDALNEMMREGAQVTAAARTPLERHNDELARLQRLLERGAISPETYLRAVKAENEEFAKARTEITALESAWKTFGEGFQDVLTNQMVDGFRKGVRGMLDAFGDMIRRMLAQAAAAQIAQALLGGFAGLGKAAMGWFSPYAGGGETADVGGFMSLEARASGGPVTGGAPYIIGERGPELFVPSVSGQVVSSDDLARASGQPQRIEHVHRFDEHAQRSTLRQWWEGELTAIAAAR